MPFIDAETGTVINGPIFYVREDIDLDDLSDSELIDLAHTGDFIAGYKNN